MQLCELWSVRSQRSRAERKVWAQQSKAFNSLCYLFYLMQQEGISRDTMNQNAHNGETLKQHIEMYKIKTEQLKLIKV